MSDKVKINYNDTFTTTHSRDYYRGKSFHYAGEWVAGAHYTSDDYVIDFVSANNTLLACAKSHLSSLDNEPNNWITDDDGFVTGVVSIYWDFILAGKIGDNGRVYVPEYNPETGVLTWTLIQDSELTDGIDFDLQLTGIINEAINRANNASSQLEGIEANIKSAVTNATDAANNANRQADLAKDMTQNANTAITNLDALFNSGLKQGTGSDETSLMSQKAITDALNAKVDKINGTAPFVQYTQQSLTSEERLQARENIGIDWNSKQDKDNNLDLNTVDKSIVGAINEVFNEAKASVKNFVYDSYVTLIATLHSLQSNALKRGDILFIKAANIPDLYISDVLNEYHSYNYTTDATLTNDIYENNSIAVGYFELRKVETDLHHVVKNTSVISSSGEGNVISGITIENNGDITLSLIQVVTPEYYEEHTPTKVSDLENDLSFIDATVNNLSNYYTKNETYTRAQINNLVQSIPQFKISVVSALPQVGNTATIYLLRTSTASGNDLYDEWIYTNGRWELLGSARVDLSNYYNKTETDSAISAALTVKLDRLTSSTVGNIPIIGANGVLEDSNLNASSFIQPSDITIATTAQINSILSILD